MERHSFCIVLSDGPKLCGNCAFSQNFQNHEIMWNYGILCSEYSSIPKHRSHIKYELFYGKDKCKQYKSEIEKPLQKQPFWKNIQQKWTNIVTAKTTAVENTFGIKSKQKHHVNKKINELSELKTNVKLQRDLSKQENWKRKPSYEKKQRQFYL